MYDALSVEVVITAVGLGLAALWAWNAAVLARPPCVESELVLAFFASEMLTLTKKVHSGERCFRSKGRNPFATAVLCDLPAPSYRGNAQTATSTQDHPNLFPVHLPKCHSP